MILSSTFTIQLFLKAKVSRMRLPEHESRTCWMCVCVLCPSRLNGNSNVCLTAGNPRGDKTASAKQAKALLPMEAAASLTSHCFKLLLRNRQPTPPDLGWLLLNRKQWESYSYYQLKFGCKGTCGKKLINILQYSRATRVILISYTLSLCRLHPCALCTYYRYHHVYLQW